MRSHANLSIYRVSEASNESPDKLSSGKPSNNIAPPTGGRGRVSASFYFHANKLSAWQSELSNHEEKPEEESKSGSIMMPNPEASMIDLSRNPDESSRIIKIQRSINNESSQPLTTMCDNEARYPYFSNPSHIRSMKSLHDYGSATGSPQADNRSMASSKIFKGESGMVGQVRHINNNSGGRQTKSQNRAQRNNKNAQFFLEEISPHSQCSEAGDVSFESKGFEQDYDQICLKVCLHPLHFVIKNLIQQHFKKNGGGANQSVGKILQSKSSLAINITLWKNKLRFPAVLAIAHGIMMIASKDNKQKLLDPFNFKSVQSLVVAHNQSALCAMHLTEASEVTQGFSHVVIETQSLGLLMRYVMHNYQSVKLNFADSIALSENGCLDELYFQQLYGNNSQESDGQMSVRSGGNAQDQERISQALLNMNSRGLISSRSDVIALLSGELLELRTEKSYLFQMSYHWEPHYYLLTSIGIFKFVGADMVRRPLFVPLRSMVHADMVEDEHTQYSTEKILQVTYKDPEAGGAQTDMLLSSETVSQVIEWTEMIKRLRQLYSESKSAIEALPNKSNGKSLFDNSTKAGSVSALHTVQKICTPNRRGGAGRLHYPSTAR